MHNLFKKFCCLLLSAILLTGITAHSLAETLTYNYKVKNGITLYVRKEPSTKNASLGSLSGGTRISVFQTEYAEGRNWGKITYGGKDAWVCIDYCDKIDTKTVTPEIPSEMQVDWTVIDISKFQRPEYFDWNAVRESGVKGVIIRIGGRGVLDRNVYADDSFMTHYNNAVAAGLYVGVYFFSYALNAEEAREEADFTVDTLQANDCKLLLPVFIDIEDYSEGNFSDTQHRRSDVDCNAIVNAFCDTVKAAGYYPGIYCNLDYTKTVLSPSVFSGERAVWIAQWNNTCDYTGTYHMWQYTDKGKIDGYPYRLDISRCYMNFPKLIEEADNSAYGDHTASDWKVTKEAICGEPGERVIVCTDSDCGKTLAKEIIQPSFSSHKRSERLITLVDKEIKAGDILTESQLTYLHTENEVSGYGITYGEACTTSGGVMLTYCKDCKTVLTVSYYYGNNCEHSSVTSSETAASCTKAGIETDTCTACKKVTSAMLTSPLAHNTDKVTNSATCTSDGEKTFTCSSCGETVRTDFAPQKNHVLEEKYNADRPSEYCGTVSVIMRCKNCEQNIVLTATYGDTEGKGSVAVSDARTALRNAVGLDTLTPLQTVAADIDMDGSVTVSDARYILRIAVGLDSPSELYGRFKTET